MPLISDLVLQQQRYESQADLRQSIGDGYLNCQNPLYKQIRALSISLGATYSSRRGLYDYQICRDLAFHRIILNKTVPYLKNLPALLEMNRVMPSLPISEALEIKKNSVLHESCHLIAHDIFDPKCFVSSRKSYQDWFVLTSLLGESFASGCETLGQLYASDQIHTWMYSQNANLYGCEGPEYRNLLLEISSKFGMKFCAELTILSFLCWNFYYINLHDDTIAKILRISRYKSALRKKDLATIGKFCRYHFRINNWFRNQIAQFYFCTSGFQCSLATLLRVDFFSFFDTHPQLKKKFEKLIDVTFDSPLIR